MNCTSGNLLKCLTYKQSRIKSKGRSVSQRTTTKRMHMRLVKKTSKLKTYKNGIINML